MRQLCTTVLEYVCDNYIIVSNRLNVILYVIIIINRYGDTHDTYSITFCQDRKNIIRSRYLLKIYAQRRMLFTDLFTSQLYYYMYPYYIMCYVYTKQQIVYLNIIRIINFWLLKQNNIVIKPVFNRTTYIVSEMQSIRMKRKRAFIL